MLIPFVGAGCVILLTLSLTLWGTQWVAMHAPNVPVVGLVFTSVVAFGLAKACTLIYRVAMSLEEIAPLLHIRPPVFAATAAIVISGILYFQGLFDWFKLPFQIEWLWLLASIGWMAFLWIKVWRLTPSMKDAIGAIFGFFLLTIGLTLPAYTVVLALKNINASHSGAIAAWAGTLASTAVSSSGASHQLVDVSIGKGLESLIKRDAPTLLATAVALLCFRHYSSQPVVFSIAIGVVGGLLGAVMSAANSDT